MTTHDQPVLPPPPRQAAPDVDESPTSPPPVTTKKVAQRQRYAGIAAGAALVLGAMLPWASIKTIFGSVSATGLEGGDGALTAALGILGAVAVWKAGKWLWAAIVSGALATVIAIYEMANVGKIVSEVNDTGIAAASIGIGLYLTLAASIVLGIAGFRLHRQ